MTSFDSPVIEIRVNRPKVDLINVSAEEGMGWKTDGRKGDQLVAPDQYQDDLHALISDLAPYVDENSVWINTETGAEISVWAAMKLLSGVGGN